MGQIWTWPTLRAALRPYGANAHLLWDGPVNKGGYGYTSHGGKQWYVHILAYTLSVGPVPVGQVLRKRCKLKNCCNPEHYRPSTRSDNLIRLVEQGQVPSIEDVAWRGGRGRRKVREEEAGYATADGGVQQEYGDVQPTGEG